VEAALHHSEALQGFQQAVNHIAGNNSEALLVWSILNIVYVFGLSKRIVVGGQYKTSRGVHNHMDRVMAMEWIPIMRADVIFIPDYNFLRFGRFKTIVS
jgi:hypothetical protein